MIASLHIPYLATTLYATDHQIPLSYPLALVDQESLYALNHVALEAGLHRHMPEREAANRAPDVLLRAAQPLRDAEVLGVMMECVQTHTDTLEPISSPQMPHILMKMPVHRRNDQVTVAQAIGQSVRTRTGLNAALAIAPTIFTARTAANHTPLGNVRYVEAGKDKALLAPLPVELLPLSEEMLRSLHHLGIVTIGQFAALPLAAVLHQFGAGCRVAHEIANGRDPSPLRPIAPLPSLEITHCFHDPVTYRQPLDATLASMSQWFHQELLQRRASASIVRLIVFTEEDEGYERKTLLRDPIRETNALTQVLARLLRLIPLQSGVVEMKVVLEGLGSPVAGLRQLGFLDHLHPKGMLERLFPRLLDRYGHSPFWRIVFRTDREGYPLEDQFDFVPF